MREHILNEFSMWGCKTNVVGESHEYITMVSQCDPNVNH